MSLRRPAASLLATLLLAVVVAAPVAAAPGASAGLHPTGLIPVPVTGHGPTLAGEQLMAAATAVPDAVDLSADAPPVGNQGSVGSCTSWATGYYERYWLRHHALGDTTLFAPMYLYAQISKGVDAGSSFGANFNIMTSQGIAPRSVYWQGSYDYTTQPDAAEIAAAAPYRGSGYSAIFSGVSANSQTTIQAALAAGKPVMIAIPVYPEFDRASSSNPLIDVPTVGETSRGWHAVWAPRYDAQGLWIENSWGTGWGAGGWGHLTWAFVNGYAREGYTYTSTYDVAPGTTVVYSMTPSSGPVGTSVTLTGSAFTGVTAVAFAGTPATFSVVNDTTITTTVPAGAASGYITLTSPSNPSAGSPSAFTVSKTATGLTYGGPTSVRNSTTATLSATLRAGTTPLAGQTVTFTIGSMKLTAVTNSLGVAQVSWTAPKSKSPAKLTIGFAGTAIYAASSVNVTIKIQ